MVAGHFGEWQLIFYGTKSPPVNLTDTPLRRTKPPSSAANVSVSTVVTTTDSITRINVTSAVDVSTSAVADTGVTTTRVVADQLTLTANSTSSPPANLSVVKELTVKDSDAENSTELKSGVIVNGTFVTSPPAPLPGRVSNSSSSEEQENKTSALSRYPDVTVGSPVSDARNSSLVYELQGNFTESNRTYENASYSAVNASVVPAAVVNVSASLSASETVTYEESFDFTSAIPTAVSALLYGEVYRPLYSTIINGREKTSANIYHCARQNNDADCVMVKLEFLMVKTIISFSFIIFNHYCGEEHLNCYPLDSR